MHTESLYSDILQKTTTNPQPRLMESFLMTVEFKELPFDPAPEEKNKDAPLRPFHPFPFNLAAKPT